MYLDKKKGVNPRICSCPRCGKDNDELILLGNRETVRTCSCGTSNYGATKLELCGKCKKSLIDAEARTIGEYEKIPTSLCKTCKAELDSFDTIIKEGGIYWECQRCKSTGVYKAASPFAKAVREDLGVAAPEPAGAKIPYCPVCEKEEEK